MQDNEKDKKLNTVSEQEYKGKTYAFIAIGLIAAGALFLGLSFTVMGKYSLIASELLQVAALTFLNVQKKRNNLKWLLPVRIVCYVLLAAALLIFVGAIIWSAS